MTPAKKPGVVQQLHNIIHSAKWGGISLICCTFFSLLLANSAWGKSYLAFWHWPFAGLSIELWINDALMAIFFLSVGLELKREILLGELANIKTALLPIIAALGGIIVPASFHYLLNNGTPTQAGCGIPMATDIAFALGVLALLGRQIPVSLKIFLTALAVIDDLGAIVVIAVFYTASLSPHYLYAALLIFILLILANRMGRLRSLWVYLPAGIILWFCMLQSGVHATIAGVLLAFTIPLSPTPSISTSHYLERILHVPVLTIILPLFALANTAIIIDNSWYQQLFTANSLGIMGGLLFGKPVGIALFCFFAVRLGICQLPITLKWSHIGGAGLLGGIGFTMSIFITNLAFNGNTDIINSAKIAILLASLFAGIMGYVWLRVLSSRITS